MIKELNNSQLSIIEVKADVIINITSESYNLLCITGTKSSIATAIYYLTTSICKTNSQQTIMIEYLIHSHLLTSFKNIYIPLITLKTQIKHIKISRNTLKNSSEHTVTIIAINSIQYMITNAILEFLSIFHDYHNDHSYKAYITDNDCIWSYNKHDDDYHTHKRIKLQQQENIVTTFTTNPAHHYHLKQQVQQQRQYILNKRQKNSSY